MKIKHLLCAMLFLIIAICNAGTEGIAEKSELPVLLRIEADFEVSDTTGYAPLTVQFRDLTSGNPSAWEWDFENDGILDSFERNPLWTFMEAGVYSVSLTVLEEGTSEISTILKTDLINVIPIIDGLVAFYPFNGNAEDYSVNEYDGVAVGAILTEDRYGNPECAYEFQADGGHVEIPYNLFADGFPFSVAFWFKANTFEHNYHVTFGSKTWDGGGEDVYYSLAQSNVGKDHVSFHLGNGNGGGPQHRISYHGFYTFSLHQWYQVIFIVDNMYMDEGRMLVNGEDIEFEHVSGSATSVDFSGGTFDIGATKCNGHSYSGEFPLLDGAIDDFYIFNRLLTDEEIEEIYNPGLMADFSAEPLTGFSPLTVQFTDLSSPFYPATSWQWDFDGDNQIDSYTQNPVHTYNEEGLYTVKLRVYSQYLNYADTEVKEDYIEVISGLMYGDIDDNRLVESVDAALALMYSVGLDPIPEDPLPWEDWRQLQADVDQNGEVGAVDGAYILQYVVGIIDELPVENVYRTENYITIYNDSDYLYLSSDQKISSLHYNITDWQEITLSVADVLCPNGLYFQNENQLAMAAAEGFSGTFLRIPYLSDDLSGSSITMEIECDGFKDRVIYTFTEKVPAMTGLNAVYPNPFNPQTTIEYQLAKSGKVNIMAFNIKGQKVAVLVDEVQNAGKQAFIWDATGMNSGIYLIRLTSDSSSETCKVVLLK